MTKILHRDPDRRCKKLDEWPAADRDRWRAALIPGDVLEEGGSRASYGRETNLKVAKGYGKWLTWLDSCGLLELPSSPGDRITPARVRDYIAALEMYNAPQTILGRLAELRAAAKVMDPRRDWSWIQRIGSRIRARDTLARPKRPRLVGAGELLDLGLELIARSGGMSTVRQRTTTYRDGLIVALLAARPLRLRNLAGLVLDHSVVRRGDQWWIQIPRAETKTNSSIELPWPDLLVPYLEVYLDHHRPALASMHGRWTRPSGRALWLSTDGSPMTKMAIYDRIIARTRHGLGRPINPHLFRDCAATTMAIGDPAHVAIVSLLLGHRRSSTTERYYNQAGAIEASRQMQAFLLSLREGDVELLEGHD